MEDISCFNCDKSPVCIVYRDVHRLLEKIRKGNNVDEKCRETAKMIAKLCVYYNKQKKE